MTTSRKERRFYVIYTEPSFPSKIGQIVWGTSVKSARREFEHWYNKGQYKTVVEIRKFNI